MENSKNNSGKKKLLGIISSCFVTGFVGGISYAINKESKRKGISIPTLSKEKYDHKKENFYTHGRNQYISIKKAADDVSKDASLNAKKEIAVTK